MGHRLVPSLIALALPAAMAWGAELPTMRLEPSQPPPAQSAGDRLVDSVIPAYGVRDASPYRLSSRMTTLYSRVNQFAAHIDALVLSNTLALPDDSWQLAANDPFPTASRPSLVPAGLLAQQTALLNLVSEVSLFEEQTPLPNHYERWHINTAYRDLFRAGEHLALGLGDPRFANLRDLHRAWKDYHHRLIQAEFVRQMGAFIESEQTKLRQPNIEAAMQEVARRTITVPWPTMSLDLEQNPYAPVFLPAIPRWSEASEEARNRFIERFGIPGQAISARFPVSDVDTSATPLIAPTAPAAAGEDVDSGADDQPVPEAVPETEPKSEEFGVFDEGELESEPEPEVTPEPEPVPEPAPVPEAEPSSDEPATFDELPDLEQ